MKHVLLASSALAGVMLLLPHIALAAGSVVVCDPTNAGHCLVVNSDGSINTSGGTSGNVTVTSGNISTTPQGGSSYSNRANWIGNTTTVANTTAATVTAAPGAGLSLFVTDLQCGNTGNTTVTATFNDNPATILILPTVGGSNVSLQTPHELAGNTALTVTLSANTTSVTCTDGGFKATT